MFKNLSVLAIAAVGVVSAERQFLTADPVQPDLSTFTIPADSQLTTTHFSYDPATKTYTDLLLTDIQTNSVTFNTQKNLRVNMNGEFVELDQRINYETLEDLTYYVYREQTCQKTDLTPPTEEVENAIKKANSELE